MELKQGPIENSKRLYEFASCPTAEERWSSGGGEGPVGPIFLVNCDTQVDERRRHKGLNFVQLQAAMIRVVGFETPSVSPRGLTTLTRGLW